MRARLALFEAAHVMMTRGVSWNPLKAWAMRVAARRGAKVALARKLAVISAPPIDRRHRISGAAGMTPEVPATASRCGKGSVGTMAEGKPLETSAHHDAVREMGSLRQRQPHHVSVAIAPSSRITDRSLRPANAPKSPWGQPNDDRKGSRWGWSCRIGWRGHAMA